MGGGESNPRIKKNKQTPETSEPNYQIDNITTQKKIWVGPNPITGVFIRRGGIWP